MHLYITKTSIAANLWRICCGMCSFHFSANLSDIGIICKSKVSVKKSHSDVVQKQDCCL